LLQQLAPLFVRGGREPLGKAAPAAVAFSRDVGTEELAAPTFIAIVFDKSQLAVG